MTGSKGLTFEKGKDDWKVVYHLAGAFSGLALAAKEYKSRVSMH
jgi:hypothetical protein